MILHIDDDAQVREVIFRLLSTYGYQIVQTEDGLSGLEMIRQLKPALVLLDIDLPDLSGLEVVKRVKADPDLQQIRVIAFSGSTTQNKRDDLLAAGFDDFLPKPTSMVDLLKMIEGNYPAGSPQS
jgi:CheY-like chemotaxis protein